VTDVQKTSQKNDPRPCVVRCQLWGSQKCTNCPIPGSRGEALCPKCGCQLYPIGMDATDVQFRWGCSALRGCGENYSFPVGDPGIEAAADAELADLKRARDRERKRRQRQRRTDLRCHTKCPSKADLERPGARWWPIRYLESFRVDVTLFANHCGAHLAPPDRQWEVRLWLGSMYRQALSLPVRTTPGVRRPYPQGYSW